MQPSISNRFFRGTQSQARESIKTICQTQWSCVVSFVYFAQAMKFQIFQYEVKSKYKSALMNADLLTIDGIAMQIFDYSGQYFFKPKPRQRTQNLNGTDFLPFILNQTRDQKVGIILSTVYDPKLEKWTEWMDKGLAELQRQYPHIEILLAHQTEFKNRGQDFPFEELWKILEEQKSDYDHILFLNGIGGPVQEIWTEEHRDFFDHSGLIVLNNGATIDYYSGFETRAPERVVKMRIGETLWRITTQPKKNLHKFLSMFQIVPYRGYLIKKRRKKS